MQRKRLAQGDSLEGDPLLKRNPPFQCVIFFKQEATERSCVFGGNCLVLAQLLKRYDTAVIIYDILKNCHHHLEYVFNNLHKTL